SRAKSVTLDCQLLLTDTRNSDAPNRIRSLTRHIPHPFRGSRALAREPLPGEVWVTPPGVIHGRPREGDCDDDLPFAREERTARTGSRPFDQRNVTEERGH